jgi:16S rRNA (uracil1498-N3)-methyltransferase
MRVPRIHIDSPLTVFTTVELDAEASHYLSRVLRLAAGAGCRLFNSRDGEFGATIQSISRKSVLVTLGESIRCEGNPELPIHLGLGLSRGERMDYAIQKATEMGAGEITPLFTERCEVRLDESRADKRLSHWQKVAISACEQCGRTSVPLIHPPVSLDTWLAGSHPGIGIVLDHRNSGRLQDESVTPSAVSVLIGPEGGLTAEEVAQATAKTFLPVQIGPRILRTETAPVVALTLVQLLWGDLRN